MPQIDDPTQERLGVYARALRESPHNLLSARGLEELESRHLPESVAFALALPAVDRLLDVGSGGGLPGLVIAIVRPELDVHLMEATGKKARFLSEVAVLLGCTAEVHHGRAEELAKPPLVGTFDIVTARAVAPLDRLASLCAPYLRPGGRLHAIKGERWVSELETARGALRTAGLEVVSTPADAPTRTRVGEALDGSGQAAGMESILGTAPHPSVIILERTGR